MLIDLQSLAHAMAAGMPGMPPDAGGNPQMALAQLQAMQLHQGESYSTGQDLTQRLLRTTRCTLTLQKKLKGFFHVVNMHLLLQSHMSPRLQRRYRFSFLVSHDQILA